MQDCPGVYDSAPGLPHTPSVMAQNSTLAQRVVALEREVKVNKAIAYVLALRQKVQSGEPVQVGRPLIEYVADTMSEGTALLEISEDNDWITLTPR